jgi:polyisoprenoid-binding protein YceI
MNQTLVKTKWAIDPAHSAIQFKVKHMMITNVTGYFTNYEASIETEGDDFANAEILFSADASSVNTANDQRDGHLKSADFFDVENFPKISFKVTNIEKENSSDFKITGDLTIKHITRTITLDSEFLGIHKDPWGNAKAGFSINGKINRKDWQLNWNAALETGGVLVSDEVRINCEIQLGKEA